MGNLSTPKSVQKLQMALHAKAKAEAGYRFYVLYDKIGREDILAHAYAQCRSNKGAPGENRNKGPGISRSAPHTGSDGPAQVRGIALSSWRGRYPNQNHVPFAAFFLTALSFALLAYTTGRSGNHIIAAMLAAGAWLFGGITVLIGALIW